VNLVEESGLTISNFKLTKLSKQEAEQHCETHKGKPYFNDLTTHLSSDLVLAIEIIAENCIGKVKDLASNIRSKFGQDQIRSAVLSSESATAAAKELDFFFSGKSSLQSSAYFNNCSCLVVKPHLITENYVGQVMDAVLNSGFELSAGEMFWLDRPSAEVLLKEFRNFWKSTRESYPSTANSSRNSPTDPALPSKSAKKMWSQLSASCAALTIPNSPKQCDQNPCAQFSAETRPKTESTAPTSRKMECWR
jgi:nucleoside diphosphate kinase